VKIPSGPAAVTEELPSKFATQMNLGKVEGNVDSGARRPT